MRAEARILRRDAVVLVTADAIVAQLKLAAETGHYSGLVRSSAEAHYFERCTFAWPRSPDYGAKLIYTRDIGMHTSGWFKNPDYERCYHLSLSFWQPAEGFTLGGVAGFPLDQDHAAARQWCRMFFGEHCRSLWIEPPYSAEGRRYDVYHYRLFCDAGWQPMKPRKEVYSRDFTEKGWKSFSEIHGDAAKLYEHSMGDPG